MRLRTIIIKSMNDENPIKVAEEMGFDLSLIEHSLSLTPEQRAEEHQNALDLVWELEKARLTINEESK